MQGWTVSAGSALAVVALIGGGAWAANTLGDEPAPEPKQQEPVTLVEPVEPVVVSPEQTTITQAEPEPAPEPEPVEQEPAPAPEPEPIVEEEPVVTPKPEPAPSYRPEQGNNPDAPPVAPELETFTPPSGGAGSGDVNNG